MPQRQRFDSPPNPEPALAPLVVTLRMDPASAQHFTDLRRAHFPAQRNWLDAHITLFHALPGAVIEQVMADVGDVAATRPAFMLRTGKVLFLGAGVAYSLGGSEAEEIRRTLAVRWDALLSRQDRAWRGPLHITIQNKTAPATARALYQQLSEHFVAREMLATGIDVWHYEGGPWRHAGTVAFDARR